MKFIKHFLQKYPSTWRYISSVVILIVVLPMIFINALLGEKGRYVGFVWYMLIAILGVYEVFKNLNISKISALYLSLLVIVVFVIPPHKIEHFSEYEQPTPAIWVLGQFGWNILIMCGFSFVILLLEKNIRKTWKMAFFHQAIILFVLIIVSIATKTAWIINSHKYKWLFYFLSIAIISDTFGYLGGKYFAKFIFKGKKLAPNLSPQKTWGGFIIGYIFSGLFVVIVGYLMGIFKELAYPTLTLIFMSLILPIISAIGDLFFSCVKRYLQIKNFSKLIRSHGGIMDRLDSISFVLFYITIMFLFFLLL